MFISEGLALVIIGSEFLAGALIGLITTSLILRRRLRVSSAAITCLFSGLTFLCFVGLGGWLSFSPAALGTHFALADFFAKYAYGLAALGSCAVAVGISIAGLRRSQTSVI